MAVLNPFVFFLDKLPHAYATFCVRAVPDAWQLVLVLLLWCHDHSWEFAHLHCALPP